MKQRKNRLLFIFIALLMFGAVSYYYVNHVLLPVKLKNYLETRAKEYFHRDVTIGTIQFQLIRGFTVKDVKVFRKDSRTETFLQFDEANFNILYADFFKNKKVIIPSIRMNKPYARLIRQKDNLWNFSDLLSNPSPSPEDGSFSLLIRKVTIRNGEISFLDKTQTEDFSELVQNINLNVVLSLNKIAKYQFSARAPQRNSILSSEGTYDLDTQQLTSIVSGKNLAIAQYLSLVFADKNWPLKNGVLSNARLDVIYENKGVDIRGDFLLNNISVVSENNQRWAGEINATENSLSWRDDTFKMKSTITSPRMFAGLSDNTALRGDLALNIAALTYSGQNFYIESDLTLSDAVFTMDTDKTTRGNLSTSKVTFSKQQTGTQLQGDFTLLNTIVDLGPNQSMRGNITANNTNLTFKDDKLKIQSDLDITQTNIQWGEHQKLQGHIVTDNTNFSYQARRIDIDSEIKLADALIQFSADHTFEGSPIIELLYQHNLTSEEKPVISGSFLASDGKITNAPKLGTIEHLNGLISFQPNLVKSEQLTFEVDNTEFRTSGSIKDFNNPFADIKGSSQNLNLDLFEILFPDFFEEHGIILKGFAAVDVEYFGLLKSPSSSKINVKTQLQSVDVQTIQMTDSITSMTGELRLFSDLLSWKDLTGTFRGKTYTLNGRVNNFSRPVLTTDLSTDNLKATAEINILRNAFQFVTLKGTYYRSHFDIHGDARLIKDAQPNWDLRTVLKIQLEDLPLIAPELADRIKTIKPNGLLSVESLFRGQFNDWRNWQLILSAKSPNISLFEHVLDNFSIEYAQRDQNVNQCDITANIYNGLLAINSTADLTQPDAPFSGALSLENLDLAKLRKEKNLKNRNLEGKLMLISRVAGKVKDIDKLTGEGSLAVTDGFLGKLIPQFKDTYFTGAKADFTIAKRRISTQNAEVFSKVRDLRVKGWVDFDQNIHFNIVPILRELQKAQIKKIGIDPTEILANFSSIEATGTIQNPKFKVNIEPGKATADIFNGGIKVIGNVLEGLL